MIQVEFRRMERSLEFEDLIASRIEDILEEVPQIVPRLSKVAVMRTHSWQGPKRDQYQVKIRLYGGSLHGLVVLRSAQSFEDALERAAEDLLVKIDLALVRFWHESASRFRAKIVS